MDDIVSASEYYLRETPVNPIFCTSVSVQNWGTKANTGAFGRFRFVDNELAKGVNPFKGCSTFKSNPQRLYVVLIGKNDDMDDVLYTGDAVLRNWGDGPKGSWFEVSFSQTPENRDWNPLAGTEAHSTSGEQISVISWFLDDSEQRIENVNRKPVFSSSQTSPIKQSQVKCRQDGEFQKWTHVLAERMHYDIDESLSASEYASQVVHKYLDVSSRSIMSEDTEKGLKARQRWRQMVAMYVEEVHNGF